MRILDKIFFLIFTTAGTAFAQDACYDYDFQELNTLNQDELIQTYCKFEKSRSEFNHSKEFYRESAESYLELSRLQRNVDRVYGGRSTGKSAELRQTALSDNEKSIEKSGKEQNCITQIERITRVLQTKGVPASSSLCSAESVK